MEPCSFQESNATVETPEGIDPIACFCLSVCVTRTTQGTPCIVSCWKLTSDEIDEFNRTGRIYVTVAGDRMSPIMLTVRNPVMNNKDKKQ